MILLIDNYDSFTYNLVDYFGRLGVDIKVFRNDEDLGAIEQQSFNGLVLSPGPEKPISAGNLNRIVERYLGSVPILGICLGHQAIAEYLGAELVKATYPMHGKISEIEHNEGEVFKNLPKSFKVVRYHSLVVRDLPKALRPTARTANGELMAFESEPHLMAWGLQFHPEAILTQYGLEMLRNWVTFYNIV